MTQKTKSSKSSSEPLQARALETRTKILEVAMRIFAERGYDGANTRDIALEAGATHGAIRYHFGTKERLWKAMIERMFAQLVKDVYADQNGAPESRADPVAILRSFLSRYIRYCAKYPDHARIMISESVRGGPRQEWMANEFIKPRQGELLKSLKSLIETGLVPNVQPVPLLYLIVSMCQMPFVISREIKLLHGIDLTDEMAIETHIESVVTVLIHQANS